MSNVKKFLDLIGITHLWTRIEENFLNNEEFAIIINAIDETKQDKNLIITKGADGLSTHSPEEILTAVNNGINVYYTPNINTGTLHPYLEGSSQTSYFHSNYIDNSRVVATGFLIDSNKNITVSNYSALDNYYNKTEVDEFHSSLEEYIEDQAKDSVKKYFLIIETTKQGSNYLLDGITFDEIYEKFNTGNVNMVCHVDGTDYIPLLSVTSSSIIFSGIYNTTSVSLVFNTQGVGTLTSTYLSKSSDLNRYYTKTETDNQIANLVNSAPETLDTLGELATALQENEDVVNILNEAIITKYSADNPPPYPVVSVQGQTGEVIFNSETWTFTLADGTVITKLVLIG